MTEYKIVNAEREHFDILAKTMDDVHREEISTSLDITPYQAIMESVERSAEAYTAFADEILVAMFGVIRYSSVLDTGVVWFLSSWELSKHKKALLKLSKQYVNSWSETYSPLLCFVDERYSLARKWIRLLGFEPIPPIKRPDKTYYPFKIEKKICAQD